MAHDPWSIAAEIDAGEEGALRNGVAYLAQDPWVFRSGYGKALLLRRMKREESRLSEDERDRLRHVLVRYVDVGDRWDLREACSLARTLDDPWLRDQLVVRLNDEDERLALRAVRMLLARRRLRLGEQEVARAREVLLVAAARRTGVPRWVDHAVRRLWSKEWGRELLALEAADEPLLSTGAGNLLRTVPMPVERLRESSP